jgi:(p)ppGpp synthase/HD superfamily hydrolase
VIEENRETFFKRLEPFLAPSVLLDVQLAYTMAKFGHRSQVRKEAGADGNPQRYFEHVRRVAITLIDEVKVAKAELVIAALLHDGIEDTRDLTPAMIEHCFGADVATIVMTLSKVPKEGYLDRFKMCSDWRPYLIKACDRLDNLRSLKAASPDFQRKQILETRDKYYPLFDRMLTLTPAEHLPRAQHVRDLVIKATERQAMMLEIISDGVPV